MLAEEEENDAGGAAEVMIRTGTKGLIFSPGCSHGPGVKVILVGCENAAHL